MRKLSLGEIAQKHRKGVVFADTSIFLPINCRRYMDIRNPEGMKIFAEYTDVVNRIVEANKNILVVTGVKKEYFPFLRDIRELSDLINTRATEEQSQNGILKLVGNMNSLNQNIKHRNVHLGDKIYEHCLDLTKIIAEDIHLFSDNPKHEYENQGESFTDEQLVATAFSYSMKGEKSVGMASFDSRFAALFRGLRSISYSRTLLPHNKPMAQALDQAPITLYEYCGENYTFQEYKKKVRKIYDRDFIEEVLPVVQKLEKIMLQRNKN